MNKTGNAFLCYDSRCEPCITTPKHIRWQSWRVWAKFESCVWKQWWKIVDLHAKSEKTVKTYIAGYLWKWISHNNKAHELRLNPTNRCLCCLSVFVLSCADKYKKLCLFSEVDSHCEDFNISGLMYCGGLGSRCGVYITWLIGDGFSHHTLPDIYLVNQQISGLQASFCQ